MPISVERVWHSLLEQCAAHKEKDWHKVKRLVTVSKKQLERALREGAKE